MASPDAIIGSITGVVDLIRIFETYAKKYVKRRDTAANNVELHARVLEDHATALHLFGLIEQEQSFDHIPLSDELIRGRLIVMKSRLQTNNQKLNSMKDEIRNASATSRVNRDSDSLHEYMKDVTDFYNFVTDKVIPSLKENVPSHQNLSESYVPNTNVPPNPPRLTLDYNNVETCEGRLKAAILEGSRNGIVGVVASGLGGVGKTCALRGLAQDKQVKNRFPGGILYISLGNDSHLSDIINGIAGAVKRTGGKQLASSITKIRTVHEAVDAAETWFRPRKCLFLVDDIWWVHEITSQVFRDLRTMLHEESLLVYTTRDERFLKGADSKVMFEVRETHGALAQRMLMNHAGFHEKTELSSPNREAFEGILRLCNGLPLAFGIAGATVMKYSDHRKENKQDGWSIYYGKLRREEKRIIDGDAEEYGPLIPIVDRSLDVLDSETCLEKKYKRPFKKMFQGFCVLRKQQRVSGDVLRRLWSLNNVREAEEIAEEFQKVSLLQMTWKEDCFFVQLHDLVLGIATQRTEEEKDMKSWFQTLADSYIPGVRSMDVESEVKTAAEETASGSKFGGCISAAIKWARRCICTGKYDVDDTGSMPIRKEEKAFTPRTWWNIEDDGFIHDNVCRVLQKAGEIGELVWLLERAQWIVMRLQKGGISRIEQDLEIGMQVSEQEECDETGMVGYLKLLGKAVRMSCIPVAENAYEAWFQIYGRMVWYANQCRRTRKFILEIQEHAPRPWVKASVGFLDEAGGVISETIRIKHCKEIFCIHHGGDMIRILWRYRRNVGFITEYDKMDGSGRTYLLGSAGSDSIASRDRHSLSYVQSDLSFEPSTCVGGAFSDNQKRLVTTHLDGRVVVWDVVGGYKVWKYLKCSEAVYVVRISGDGSTVAYILNGCIFVWDPSRDEEVDYPVPVRQVGEDIQALHLSFDGSRIVCIAKYTFNMYVWDKTSGGFVAVPDRMRKGLLACAAISRNGRMVVTGSHEGIIRIWNVDCMGGGVRTIHEGITPVRRVALSGDGKIVCASTDHTIRVLDAESDEMIGEPLDVGWIENFAVNGDGKEIVSEVSSERVRVFDMEEINNSLRPDRCVERVECVAYCGNGNRRVTRSDDGRVREWDTESGERIGEALQDHTSVKCIAVSADGKRIVSGSEDGAVRVWDVAGSKAVGQPLVQVEGQRLGRISSVAVNNDGTRVVFCSSVAVFVWDVADVEVESAEVAMVTRKAFCHTCVAISADGAVIAFRTYKDVTVWDVQERRAAGSLKIDPCYVRSLALSNDGARVVSGSQDCTVRVWDVASGEQIARPFVHPSQVLHVQVGGDASWLVSYDDEGCGRLWHVKRDQCIMTSSHPDWTSTVHLHGVARFSLTFPDKASGRIMANTGREQGGLLASTDKPIVRVGDVYFSNSHGSALWPFARVVR